VLPIIVGDLIALSLLQKERAAVHQLRRHLALHTKDNVTFGAPMIGAVAGRIFDQPYADFPKLSRAPCCVTRLARMGLRRDRFPIRYPKWNFLELHEQPLLTW